MIIILGSTGFIGKALFNHFKEKQVKCLGISSKQIDLTNNFSIKKLAKLFNKNIILIFASSIVKEKGDNLKNMQKNINMAKNVAKAIQLKPIKKVVFISSIDVYGKPVGKISEQTLLNPQTPYGISKLTSEFILRVATEKSGTPLLILRIGGIFGSGQSPQKYGPNFFIYSALNNKQINIFGDGKELRDLVFIKDLVKIISHFCLNKTNGIINVATGRSKSFLSIVKLLQKLLSGRIEIISKTRVGEKTDFIFDNSNLKKYLPKTFKFTPPADSIKEIIDSAKFKT